MGPTLAVYRSVTECDDLKCHSDERWPPLAESALVLPLRSAQLRCVPHEGDIRRPHHLRATQKPPFGLPGAAFKRRRASEVAVRYLSLAPAACGFFTSNPPNSLLAVKRFVTSAQPQATRVGREAVDDRRRNNSWRTASSANECAAVSKT